MRATLCNSNSFHTGFLYLTADVYLRHPNSYLPNYVQSETDGENRQLNGNIIGRREIDGLDIGPHQIVESDEDDIPSYGFPSQIKRRNRRGGSNNVDDVLLNGGKMPFL